LAFADFDQASLQLAGWLEHRQLAEIGEPAARAED
jgi:hypothetical protein